jgi:hypothetical protein
MEEKRRTSAPLQSVDPDNDVIANKSGLLIPWAPIKWLLKRSIPFIVGALVGGLGGWLGTYAISHNPVPSHRPTAESPVPVPVPVPTSDLEITDVQGGPDTVPCHPTVQGQGPVPKGMTAAVYAEAETDHQRTHWYEPVSNFTDSTHWWVNISLKTANNHYQVGVILIPTQLAAYLSTAEKSLNPTYTYWSSPGYPPGASVSENTMLVTRTDQPC